MERMGDPIVLPQSRTILTEQTILACKWKIFHTLSQVNKAIEKKWQKSLQYQQTFKTTTLKSPWQSSKSFIQLCREQLIFYPIAPALHAYCYSTIISMANVHRIHFLVSLAKIFAAILLCPQGWVTLTPYIFV